MATLKQHFDRIAIISLPDRTDRRTRLMEHLNVGGLADPADLTWVAAVDGRAASIPSWWLAGPGAWGCRASQWKAISAAQRDGVEQLLILEDDACFHPRTAEWLPEIMRLLPEDWDLFFLGGQHLLPPQPTAHARLLEGRYITRTHAYAVHHRAYATLLAEIGNDASYEAHPKWHVDHQLGHGQRTGLWKAYAPAWWLAAQDEGESNISLHQDQRRWWQEGRDYWRLPFVTQMDPALHPQWLCPPGLAVPEDPLAQAVWLRDLAREAWQQGRLPTCPLPAEQITRLWPGGVRAPQDPQELAHLADYPANGLFPHPFSTVLGN